MHEAAQHYFFQLVEIFDGPSHLHLGELCHGSPLHHVPTLWPPDACLLLVPSSGCLLHARFDMPNL